jgi:hypothetical protein
VVIVVLVLSSLALLQDAVVIAGLVLSLLEAGGIAGR